MAAVSYIPWSVILNIVLLNLLDVVVRLWPVHALGVFPNNISQQAHNGQHNSLKPKHRAGIQPRNHTMILHGKVDLGGHYTVNCDENIPNSHAAWDGQHVVLGPVVRNKCRFAQYSQENCGIQCCSPDPVASNLAVSLNEIAVPE